MPFSLSTPRKKCLPTPSVPSCTFAAFFSFRLKTVLVSMTRRKRSRSCSHFRAETRKNSRRCFISDRISRRNLEQVTARTCSRLSPSYTCPRVPTYHVFSSLRHALASSVVLDPSLLFAKCLRTVAAVASRRLQDRCGPSAEIDDVAKCIRNASSTSMRIRSANVSSIYQRTRSPRSNLSRRVRPQIFLTHCQPW